MCVPFVTFLFAGDCLSYIYDLSSAPFHQLFLFSERALISSLCYSWVALKKKIAINITFDYASDNWFKGTFEFIFCNQQSKSFKYEQNLKCSESFHIGRLLPEDRNRPI